MNRTEADYAEQLRLRMLAGDILSFDFERIKLRLADNTFYTPDFFVVNKEQELEFHEVKGFWEDDARVKIKVAADIFPFKFIAVTKEKGEWKTEEI